MPNLRDVAVVLGAPRLRRMVHRMRAAGLETLIDYQRLALLVATLRQCRDLDGDVIEFGSYRGGSAGVMGQELLATGKTLHVCDSFQGLPRPNANDNYHHEGDFADTDEARVRAGLQRLGVRADLHVGFFNDTLPALVHLRFCVAHIDVDLHDSVRDCLEFCYPRTVSGGIIIIDDYAAPTCLGAKTAADTFFADKVEVIVPLSHSAHGVMVGSDGSDLQRLLRRQAGWTSALPIAGPAIHR
jgi:O-methyltransferase